MLFMIVAMPLMLVTMPRGIILRRRRRRPGRGLARTGDIAGASRALDDLVELATIEPDAATLRTVVDLHALAISHDEIDRTDGAIAR